MTSPSNATIVGAGISNEPAPFISAPLPSTDHPRALTSGSVLTVVSERAIRDAIDVIAPKTALAAISAPERHSSEVDRAIAVLASAGTESAAHALTDFVQRIDLKADYYPSATEVHAVEALAAMGELGVHAIKEGLLGVNPFLPFVLTSELHHRHPESFHALADHILHSQDPRVYLSRSNAETIIHPIVREYEAYPTEVDPRDVKILAKVLDFATRSRPSDIDLMKRTTEALLRVSTISEHALHALIGFASDSSVAAFPRQTVIEHLASHPDPKVTALLHSVGGRENDPHRSTANQVLFGRRSPVAIR